MSYPPQRRRAVAAPSRRPPVELRSVKVIIEADPEPDASYLEQREFEDRLASYKAGEFDFMGARIEAEVLIAETVQTLSSPGVAGIESDTDGADLDGIIGEEWTQLRVVLKTVGVPTEQLPLNVKREWIEWRT